ncbi:MAG: peptidoglycan-binding protein [Clostridia bacterium]|nr:peptidoglycan-binding protein [Clostridia bacterium]
MPNETVIETAVNVHTKMNIPTERSFSGITRAIACLLIVFSILATTPTPTALAERTGKVTATELNIRKSASSSSEKVSTVKKGATLTILGTKGDWYRVRFGKTTGYVAKQYVSVSGSSSKSSSSSSNSGKTIASLGSAPKASKPGDKGSHVTKLQQALTISGHYNGKVSGNYGELTEKAVRSFQRARGLKADGIAGSGTIKALFGSSSNTSSTGSSRSSSSAKAKTEKLDWFKDGKNVIPKNAVFTIKDVRSGRTFQARRWSGGNHIDAEPYRKEDTATMKKCFGGSWSWDRRPILIQYKGRVFAASMNGMPHSTHGNVKNNNFEGVFCIHFYKSKTHGTARVDALHQACVNEAARASW